jgi:putative glycerol-1-phosphate prenyltransferase
LIDGGKVSSVQYISNTLPIPADKKEIALSTAIAGELLGMRLTYLEAGSGAIHPVPSELISLVSKKINTPIIVGGGIKSTDDIGRAFDAGADLVVVGNVLEDESSLMKSFTDWVAAYNNR